MGTRSRPRHISKRHLALLSKTIMKQVKIIEHRKTQLQKELLSEELEQVCGGSRQIIDLPVSTSRGDQDRSID